MIVIATDDSLASPATTAVDPTDMLAWLAREGVVLQSRGSVFGKQAYLCARGRRHPIVSAARLEELGFRQPADVQPVPEKLLVAEPYPGQRLCDIVIPDVLTDFDTIENVADGSLDFLVACHVIEHTRNPIGSIAAAWRKLKPGGRLVLVVPDKERTFDRDRPTTTLEHLVADHRSPDRANDYAHYEEFYALAQPIPAFARAAKVARHFAEGYAIHYHAWTHDTFAAILEYVDREICGWSHVWTHPAVADESRCIEFYAVLVK